MKISNINILTCVFIDVPSVYFADTSVDTGEETRWLQSKLGLVIIDEEQKFGVFQRDTLADRANHVLFTSATPIPRSMMLLLDKNYAVSTLVEKPPNRRPVKTVAVGYSNIGKY